MSTKPLPTSGMSLLSLCAQVSVCSTYQESLKIVDDVESEDILSTLTEQINDLIRYVFRNIWILEKLTSSEKAFWRRQNHSVESSILKDGSSDFYIARVTGLRSKMWLID